MWARKQPGDQVPAALAALLELEIGTLRDMLAHETNPASAYLIRLVLDRKRVAA